MSTDIRDLFRRRRVREPFDERLPSGVSAINIGIPEAERRRLGLDADPQQPMPQQLPQQPAPTPVVATRPRQVMDTVRQAVTQQPTVAQPQQQVSPIVNTQPQPDVMLRNDSPTATRDRRTQPRDYIADDEAALRQVRNQPRTWRDKVVDALDAVNVVAGGQKRILPTKRERAMADQENTIGQDMSIAKTRQALEQGQMVPFQLPDGTWTQIPLKQAATVGSRQQNQVTNTSLRKRQLDEHLGRWQSMTKHEAMGDAQRLYNSGAADDNEDLRDEIAKMMGLPTGTKLPPAKYGEIKIDENGNYTVIDKRKPNAPSTVTAPNAQGVPVPVQSYDVTKQKNMDVRQRRAIAAANQRAANAQAGANQRAQAAQEGANQRSANRGTKGAGGGTFNLKGWLADHPNATQDEIDATRAKARARNLQVVQ